MLRSMQPLCAVLLATVLSAVCGQSDVDILAPSVYPISNLTIIDPGFSIDPWTNVIARYLPTTYHITVRGVAEDTAWAGVVHTPLNGSILTLCDLPSIWFHYYTETPVPYELSDLEVIYVAGYSPTVLA